MRKFVRKQLLEKIEKIHEKNEADLMELLLNKLQTLLKDKPSAGVSNNFGEMLIGKGAKFTQKNLAQIDYQNVNPLGWTGDAKIDDQINTLVAQLQYQIQRRTRSLQEREIQYLYR